MNRIDNRKNNELRKISFEADFIKNSTGSVLAKCGETHVICTANFAEGVPGWLKNSNKGWLTCEYQMMPGSTSDRVKRDRKSVGGRTMEIQRLIGRSLRSIVDLEKLPGYTVHIDCDVINADGGTRCLSINGAFLALKLAVKKMMEQGYLQMSPIKESLAAISVGMIKKNALLDLCYVEDSSADVDMNIVQTENGDFIELQGTAEGAPFNQNELNSMLLLAEKGIKDIIGLYNNF